MTHVTGGCHCGKIRFEAEGDFSSGIECNCSHCDKKGFVLAFIPKQDFSLVSGEGAYTTYHFNRGAIDHNFCTTCGVQAFGFGKGPDGTEMAAINLRCVDGIDRSALNIQQVNGKDY
ncbi:GFA family protein [Hyphomonas sp. WL0036]|uniref:GFA family protein n=1 Tax=Hyphomonas sediminis TaxID=2866160 RepID=UPI001C7E5953|nr:GFA family protein [Hyphomonas sediminis]MBY9065835.1 GFA family protein [Hyphomonas sediminis]